MSLDRDRAAELVGALSDLMRSARAVAHRRSSELGASGTPVGVLKCLHHADARPGDLAASLHVAPSVVSRAVAPMETSGLIARTPDPADARASLLTLTDAGRAALGEIEQAYTGTVSRVLADWTDEEAGQATAYLIRLTEAIATLTELPHPPTSHDVGKLAGVS